MFPQRAMRQRSLHSGGALLVLTLSLLGEAVAKPAAPGEGAKNARRVKIEWVRIPGGTFMMGSDHGESHEKPRRRVQISTFWLARSEVTVEQYKVCVDAGVCSTPKTGSSYNWGKSGRSRHPVNGVDWNQARKFSQWVAGDLPSEAEWEYAARSGEREFKYPWGNEQASCDYAVMDENGGPGCGQKRTWEVCSKSRGNSAQGVCDLSGNVWEWTLDQYKRSYQGAPTNGSPVCSTPTCSQADAWRVFRGGGWLWDIWDPRAALRHGQSPDAPGVILGFRPRRATP